ncbi:MAG: NADH-quinone oxidoreductase subunit L [Planctomycetaceae bacterium]
MLEALWLIPTLPLAGFLILAVLGSRLSRRAMTVVGVGSVGLSAVVALGIGIGFVTSPPPGDAFRQTLWRWMHEGGFAVDIALYLDALSLVMVLVVTVVGFLIHLYSADFMGGDPGYRRFFASMNLFVGAMLVLVLADNLLLLYLGWEGVGLCSYLLIGFWYEQPANGRAARKAFLVTRVGDAAMAVGLFLLFQSFGTLRIQDVLRAAAEEWPAGTATATAAAALLLAGAVGKSAQLPLQTWLPDAMAGPSPVSALIHAATMVTAGVYLIARTHVLFSLAPDVETAVAVIGAATLLVAGFSALAQRDIKRVLAYSTISQIGYMFLALGVGAWSAAIFHLMTHAFFKALLFLGAGVVIQRLHGEHDMFRMGGLRKELPVTFWTFLIGAASLAALPLVTAGFYSKDLILWDEWSAERGSTWLWLAGVAGALLTSLYTFRMVFLTFFGEPGDLVRQHSPLRPSGVCLRIPLIVLAGLSVVGGCVQLPAHLGGLSLFSDFLHTALPELRIVRGNETTEIWLETLASVVALSGVAVAWIAYRRRKFVAQWTSSAMGKAIYQFWACGWGFDWLYERLFVRPYLWMSAVNKDDLFDAIPNGLARLSETLHRALSRTETGLVRHYVLGIVLGIVIAVSLVVFS